MADVITRFKLETTQYDSKLRDASKQLTDFTRTCQLAGTEFGKFAQSQVESARAFGSIETGASNVKDKLKELVNAYNQVAKAYNALTDQQKQSDYGKALGGSLQQLQGRITQTKKELYDLGDSAKSTGGFMSKLSDKFVVNIDAMKLFDLGLKAVKGALNVAKDAFFASEANIDEWGRTTRTAGDLYDGFLYSINTGDISGYLSRIDEIKKAAVEAYNELDRLATQKAINNSATQGQRVENERIRTMLRTGRYIAPADGRAPTPGLKEGDLLSKAQLATLARQLQNGQQNLNSFIRADITQAGKSIDALYKEEAKKLGLTLSDFRKGTSNMTEFDKRMEGYRQYVAYNKKYGVTDMQGYFHKPKNNPYQNFAAWGVFQDDGETFTAINNLINERAGYQSQLYSNAASNYRAINKGAGVGRGGGGGRGGGRGGAVYDPKTQALVIGDYVSPLAGVSTGWGPETPETRMANWLKNLGAPAGLTFTEATDSARANAQKEIQKEAFKEGMADFQKNFSEMLGGVNQLVGGVEQLGIKVPAGINRMLSVLQGIMSIVTAIQTLSTLKLFSGGGVVKAADGYTVPGNYGYDRVPALLTSGEVVLNRAQQSRLAGVLQDRAQGGGGSGTVRLSGEDIYIAVSNYMSRRGYGEIAFGR